VEEVYYCTNLKKWDEAGCSNYRGISLLSTSYKMLSNILLSDLNPCTDESIGVHQCEIRRNRTTDHIFIICHTLKIQGSKMTQSYISYSLVFKKAYDSVKREVLYNILKEF
jgi:hypothetical protein